MAAKTLPHHLDAEQRVLGILFLDPKKWHLFQIYLRHQIF